MLASAEALKREIEKCDVICANCHRLRTIRTAPKQRPKRDTVGRSYQAERRLAARRTQAWVLAQLRDRPCTDCDGIFFPFVMEFDHRDPASKRYEVSRMPGHAGLDRILAEAAKCDIVCANCHRDRTYRRRLAATPGRE